MARKDRSWIGGGPSLVGAALVGAALAGGGCAAGTHATDPVPLPEDEAQARATANAEALSEASEEAQDLERRLFMSEWGKVLVLAFRAHGGFDRWRLAGSVSYTRVRSERAVPAEAEGLPATAADTGPSPPGPEPRITRDRIHLRRPDGVDASPAGPEVLDLEEERVIVDLPFRLADEALRKEYLGVEHDLKTGEFFEKLRVLRAGSTADAWLVVSFDRSTWIMKRILWKKKDGGLSLTILSDWRDANGLFIAARRDTYFLDGPYGHWDLSKPDRTDRLEALPLVPGTAVHE